MMTYLALNKKRLSQLRYHPFWGLSRLTNDTERSCYDDAVFLQQHSATKQGLIEQINEVNQWSWFVRVVYWVLNINNYRVHRYQLLSYVSLSIYQQEFEKMPPHQQAHIDEVGGFVILLTSCALGAVLLSAFGAELLEVLSDWFNQRVQPFVPSEIELYSPDIEAQSCDLDSSAGLRRKGTDLSLRAQATQSSDPNAAELRNVHTVNVRNDEPIGQRADIPEEPIIHDAANQDAANQATIVVTHDIRDLLTTLGLALTVGDSISFNEIKKAYRYQLLQTHPDKAGPDSAPVFRAVMDAYQLLLESFAQQALTRQCLSFNDIYEREVMEWTKLRKEVNAYCKKVDKYCEHADKYIEHADKYIKHADKYIEHVDRYIEDSAAYCKKVTALSLRVNALYEYYVEQPEIKQSELIEQQRMQTLPDESILSNTASYV